jgi:hypothetical protein
MKPRPAVTLSNENALSRSRAPDHPPRRAALPVTPLAAAWRPVLDRPHPPHREVS